VPGAGVLALAALLAIALPCARADEPGAATAAPPAVPASPAPPAKVVDAPAAVPVAPTDDTKPPAGASGPQVRVTDPYIELHTGPGRGFPVFYVAPRGDWIAIESRHTDWYRVRTAAGKEGWVDREQMSRTLTESGSQMSFRDVVLDDYLHRRAEFGGAWGHFSGSSMFKLWATYNLNDTFAVELTGGQVQGLYSGTSFWQLDILAEPWAEKRLSPFFGIGVGKIDNAPNASLVSDISSNVKMADAMIGLRYHLTDRLIARVDWTEYTAFISSARTDQYHSLAAGLAFFF
jgi:hypothetical protein